MLASRTAHPARGAVARPCVCVTPGTASTGDAQSAGISPITLLYTPEYNTRAVTAPREAPCALHALSHGLGGETSDTHSKCCGHCTGDSGRGALAPGGSRGQRRAGQGRAAGPSPAAPQWARQRSGTSPGFPRRSLRAEPR